MNLVQYPLMEYDPEQCVWFYRRVDPNYELSNMATGFPIQHLGLTIGSSEAMYQALRFPHHPDHQKFVLDATHPMASKFAAYKHVDDTRADWRQVNVLLMEWVLRLKLICNWNTLLPLYQASAGKPIVERSSKDPFWGAIGTKSNQGHWCLIGRNVLGKLHEVIREDVLSMGNNPQSEDLKIEPCKDFHLIDTRLLGIPGYTSNDTQQFILNKEIALTPSQT